MELFVADTVSPVKWSYVTDPSLDVCLAWPRNTSERNVDACFFVYSVHAARSFGSRGGSYDSFATNALSRVSIIFKKHSVASYILRPAKFLFILTNTSTRCDTSTVFSKSNEFQ